MPTKKQERPFPALVIVSVLLLLCLYPGQHLIASLFPGIAGRASVNPSLIILDIPIQSPVVIDLILVPALFLIIYTVVILVYPTRQGSTAWRQLLPRLGAIFAGFLIILTCIAFGALISYLLQDHLPADIKNSMGSLGINADLNLAYKPLHLHGNVILLLFLGIGLAIAIGRINKTPRIKKAIPLTREQRMSPYERMLQDRARSHASAKTQDIAGPQDEARSQNNTHTQYQPKPVDIVKAGPAETRPKPTKKPTHCHNHPLFTLEPEAVGYMPHI